MIALVTDTSQQGAFRALQRMVRAALHYAVLLGSALALAVFLWLGNGWRRLFTGRDHSWRQAPAPSSSQSRPNPVSPFGNGTRWRII